MWITGGSHPFVARYKAPPCVWDYLCMVAILGSRDVGMLGARETSRRAVRAPGARRPARSAGQNVGGGDKIDSGTGAPRRQREIRVLAGPQRAWLQSLQ